MKPWPASFPQLVEYIFEPVAGVGPYGAAGPAYYSADREDDAGGVAEGFHKNVFFLRSLSCKKKYKGFGDMKKYF